MNIGKASIEIQKTVTGYKVSMGENVLLHELKGKEWETTTRSVDYDANRVVEDFLFAILNFHILGDNSRYTMAELEEEYDSLLFRCQESGYEI